MYYYKMFGLTIESQLQLNCGEEVIAKTDAPDVKIVWKEIAPLEVKLSEEQKNNPFCCFLHHADGQSQIYFPFQGRFQIENGDTIWYDLNEGSDMIYIAQVLQCFCLTTLLIQRGSILMHGSVIAKDNKALLISGESGAGKSTLTDYLLKMVPDFLSDDIAAVYQDEKTGDIMVEPSFPMRKLCTDAVKRMHYDETKLLQIPDPEKEKYAIYCEDIYCRHAQPLHTMVIIRAKDVAEVTIEEIVGSEKIRSLTKNMFRTDVYEFTGLDRMAFLRSIAIANRINIYCLTRPEGKITVEQQANLVKQVMNW